MGLSKEQLVIDLERLGVSPGDVVMVHASLRAIGTVDGGPPAVLDAITTAVGPDGTLLMMIGADDPFAWVNERPEAERHALLAEAPPFDTATTPAATENGFLAEVFRQRPGTIVDDHPEGRFAASGRLAEALVEHPPWDDYYGAGSALERFCLNRGKVLRLGADPGTSTVLHLAEFQVDIPDKLRVRRHRRVSGPDGPVVRVVETLNDETGIVDWYGEDYFGLIREAYLRAGKGRVGKVGNAPSELFDAGDFVAFGVAWMKQNL